jgi:zinc protease
MKKRSLVMKYLFSCIVAILGIFFYVASASAIAVWPHEKSDLKPDPDVIWGKLDNGFRYVLMKNTQPKDRVSMHLNVQAGSLHEKENERGLAHFLEHMLFQGSENFEPGELVKYFQNIGMQFGPDANAYTSFNETVYDIILPDGKSKSISGGLLVMKDFAQGALLLEEQLESERKVVLAEKQSRDSASYRIFEATLDFQFPGSILPRRLPIGDEGVLKNLDRNMVKGFYDAWYRPENMMVVMVGDFDMNEATALIKETFSDMEARAPVRLLPNLGNFQHQGVRPFYHFEEEIGDVSTSIEVLEMVEPEPDSKAFKEQTLRRDIANAIVQNRLNAMIQKGNAPFTNASIGSRIYLNHFYYAEISAGSSTENWEKSLSVIEQELRKALEFGFTSYEFERVKKDYLNKLETAVYKAPTRETRELVRQLIRTVNNDRVFISPHQQRDLYVPMLEDLNVDKIHEAFKESWDKGHRLVIVTGNAVIPENTNDPESYILSVYNKSRELEVSPPEEKKPVIFPYLPEPENPGKIVQKMEFPDLGIVQIDFENGLRLNYKKTDYKAKEILAEVGFGPGKAGMPLDKPGLSELSRNVFNESGVGPLDKEDLNYALTGKNTSVEFHIDEDRFFFRANTVPDEIELLFQLLYAHIQDPAFRTEAYQLAMERYRLSYMQDIRTVEGAIKLHAEKFLAGGDTRFGLPDYETYSKLTLNDVRSWIEPALNEYPLELSVVGDFDPDVLVETVSKYMGGLPDKKVKTDRKTNTVLPKFPEGQSLQIEVDTEIPKAIFMVAYPTDDFWNIYNTRRLSLLSSVINERLRTTIREQLGVSYSQYAYNRPSKAYPGYGVFRKVVFTGPEKVENLDGALKQIASDIIDNGISDDELHRALEPTLTSIREMRRKNDYWLRSVLSGSKSHPEQLDWARNIIDDFGSITREEILKTAGKFLDNDKMAQVVIMTKF